MSSKQPTNYKIILRESDKMVADERIICNIFNDYFFKCGKGNLGLMMKYPMTYRRLMDLQKLLTIILVTLV